jgi:hypothetical protein
VRKCVNTKKKHIFIDRVTVSFKILHLSEQIVITGFCFYSDKRLKCFKSCLVLVNFLKMQLLIPRRVFALRILVLVFEHSWLMALHT